MWERTMDTNKQRKETQQTQEKELLKERKMEERDKMNNSHSLEMC